MMKIYERYYDAETNKMQWAEADVAKVTAKRVFVKADKYDWRRQNYVLDRALLERGEMVLGGSSMFYSEKGKHLIDTGRQ
jgi:hypothetical protein